MAKNTKKSANTPKSAKPAGKGATTATNSTMKAKHGKRVTREPTKSRAEVRRVTGARKGHSK